MKPTRSAWTALISVFLALALDAARRPRYGGELRLDLHIAPSTLDPAEADPETYFLTSAVFETLVHLDSRGDPQPWLAASWAHDAACKCWRFTPRANVVLHNGAPWSPAPIEIPDDNPIEEILRELSRPKNAIAIRAPDGSLSGTGPFRITRFEPGKSATLAANDAYWAGRPYLDSIRVQFGRSPADQATDFQLNQADIIEGPLTSRKSSALSEEIWALQFDDRVPDPIREAIALSIDRTAIQGVILQRQGEPSGAILPQWLTGYAFLFSIDRNLARARQLVTMPVSLSFAYDAKDPSIRAVAQRIEVNAAEAGIALRPSSNGNVRLVRLPITSRDPVAALEDVLKEPVTAAYETERSVLDAHRLIPIVHLPRIWSSIPRVHNWPRLVDVWLE